MLRTIPRQALRQSTPVLRTQHIGVRYQSTGPIKRRSFKNTLARWGIAVGGIYWYNTSPIFNETPSYSVQVSEPDSQDSLPTIASVAASSRFKPPHPADAPIIPSTPTASSPPSINPKSPDPRDPNALSTESAVGKQAATSTDPDSLEQEAAQQGAFNEETGEINWDCPCLGGMAHGPCGQEFRDAFSCFVYSDKEPKGIDCVENFEKMQTCFRANPEVYASEIEDDDRMQQELEQETGRAAVDGSQSSKSSTGMPDVDQPSVWTPISPSGDSKESPKTTAENANSSNPSAVPPPAAKSTVKADKKPVYDSNSAAKSPSPSARSSSGDKASTRAAQNTTSGREPAPEGSSKAKSETGETVPKAAHDAR